jgi:type I restriction enzyme R subunit
LSFGWQTGLRSSESDTRAKLIDPALHARGWTEDLIRREESAGAVQIIDGQPRKQAKGRVDYTLRIKVNPDTQPVAVAVIEAKPEHLPPTHGLEQAKVYAACRRLNVPFAFSSNGHLFVEYDRTAGQTSRPRPLANFPTPVELRARYEAAVGFGLSDAAARPLLIRYPGGEATRRYYQDAAIRAVLEKIARCERTGEPKRALLRHIATRHPDLLPEHRGLVAKTLADPDEVRRSARSSDARVFTCWYDDLRGGKYVMVVVVTEAAPKRHWIVTAYLTRNLLEGAVEWRKS